MAGCSTGPPGWGWEVGWGGGALDVRSSNSDAFLVLVVVNM